MSFTPTPPTDYNQQRYNVEKLPSVNTIVNIPDLVPTPATAASAIITSFLLKFKQPIPPTQEQNIIGLTIDQTNTVPTVSGAALDGTPVYSNLIINRKLWTGFDGVTREFPELIFDTVLITVQQQKNIVETQIQGSDNGAIFEYSGLGNYDITIVATVIGNNNFHNGIYPYDEVQNIIKMGACPESLSVNSWYLQMFDIYDIVITNFDVAQVEGGISQQEITILAKSNKQTELIIQ